jgi:hypothetical protein
MAATPKLGGEPPANLDAGSKRRFKRRNGQTYKSDEGRYLRYLYRPQSKTMRAPVRRNPLDASITLLAGQ